MSKKLKIILIVSLFFTSLLSTIPNISAAAQSEGFEGDSVGSDPSDTFYTYTEYAGGGTPVRDFDAVTDLQAHSGTKSYLQDWTGESNDQYKSYSAFNTTEANWTNATFFIYLNSSHKQNVIHIADNGTEDNRILWTVCSGNVITATGDNNYIFMRQNDSTWSNTTIEVQKNTWLCFNISFSGDFAVGGTQDKFTMNIYNGSTWTQRTWWFNIEGPIDSLLLNTDKRDELPSQMFLDDFVINQPYTEGGEPEDTTPTESTTDNLEGEYIGCTNETSYIVSTTVNTGGDGDTMNISWNTNKSGSWAEIGTNNSIGNGTYQQTITALSYGTSYWYSVNLTDGTNWVNNTYQFYVKEEVTESINSSPSILNLDRQTLGYSPNASNGHPSVCQMTNGSYAMVYGSSSGISLRLASTPTDFSASASTIINTVIQPDIQCWNGSLWLSVSNRGDGTIELWNCSESDDVTDSGNWNKVSTPLDDNTLVPTYFNEDPIDSSLYMFDCNVNGHQFWIECLDRNGTGEANDDDRYIFYSDDPTIDNWPIGNSGNPVLTQKVNDQGNWPIDAQYIEKADGWIIFDTHQENNTKPTIFYAYTDDINTSWTQTWIRLIPYNINASTGYDDDGVLEPDTIIIDNTVYCYYAFQGSGDDKVAGITTFNLSGFFLGGESNSAPVNSNPSPANSATGVSINLNTYSITVNDPDGDTMHTYLYSNNTIDDSWFSWKNTSGLSNGSTSWIGSHDAYGNFLGMGSGDLSYSTKYWWSANTTDGNGNWDNDTYFFTTGPEAPNPDITIEKSANVSIVGLGNTSVKVNYTIWVNNTGNVDFSWILINDTKFNCTCHDFYEDSSGWGTNATEENGFTLSHYPCHRTFNYSWLNESESLVFWYNKTIYNCSDVTYGIANNTAVVTVNGSLATATDTWDIIWGVSTTHIKITAGQDVPNPSEQWISIIGIVGFIIVIILLFTIFKALPRNKE